jgi:hypothetical protein
VYAALALTDAALVPIVFALGWRLRNRLTDHVPVTVVRRPQASC